MKKLLCSLIALLMLLTCAAAEVYVPLSTSKLPEMPDAPEAPVIVRVQKTEDSVILTLDPEWPDGATLTAYYTGGDHRVTHVNAQPLDGFTMEAASPAGDGWWSGYSLAWTTNGDALLARYNAAGGLERVSCFDTRGNAYAFDSEGRFLEIAYAESGVRARFNTRGVMTSYGYEAFRDMIVWFSKTGEVVCAEYDEGDGGVAARWEPGYGWFEDAPEGRVKIKLDVPSPWDAQRLLKPAEPAEEAEITHYPSNTICVAGLTLKEADPSLPEKWYNVLPVDLTKDGRSVYQLVISNMFYIGEVYVDVWGDEVTVSCDLVDSTAVQPLSWYGRWFTRLGDITTASIESSEDGIPFGQPLSIADDLGGADTVLLFIRSKATYYQPFRDGTTLTRYWRNLDEWKEFREGLQELMPRVAK